MPAFEHHFMPLQPMLEDEQYLNLQSRGLIDYETKSGHELKVRFLCLDEQVRVIAVTVPEEARTHSDF